MHHGQWIQDPETGEWGQVLSLRKLLWEYCKPAVMWVRVVGAFALWGAMFYLFFNGGL